MIDEEPFKLSHADLTTSQNYLGSSHSMKEVLHLVMRLVHPELKQAKFDVQKFRTKLLTNSDEVEELLNQVKYSEISSVIYREVLKRSKLWGIGEAKLPG